MSLPLPNEFSGRICAILAQQCCDRPLEEEVNNDLEGEHEIIPGLTADDIEDFDDDNPGPFASSWRASIISTSKSVTEKTDSKYQWSTLLSLLPLVYLPMPSVAWLNNVACSSSSTSSSKLLRTFYVPPCLTTLMHISLAGLWMSTNFLPHTWKHHLWQTFRCDEIQLDGSRKPPGVVRSKYTHAQKMCAFMS